MKFILSGAITVTSTFARTGKLQKQAKSCSCHREILRREQTFPAMYLHVFHCSLGEDLVILCSVLVEFSLGLSIPSSKLDREEPLSAYNFLNKSCNNMPRFNTI